MTDTNALNRHHQAGVVLIVALVFLLVLTVAGLSAMRLSNVEERMSGNYNERNLTFQVAEAALVQAETYLANQDFDANNLGTTCTESSCFTTACTDGLCFFGTFNGTDTCNLTPTTASGAVYQQQSNWDDGSGMYREYTTNIGAGSQPITARYMIEFRCFAIKDDSIDLSTANGHKYGPTYWEPLFRITAFAVGRNDGSRVMLQSLYRRD